MSDLKIGVHTKSGKKLVYYPIDFNSAGEALHWWMLALRDRGDEHDAVSFGRFAIRSCDIDYVEVY